MRAHEFMVEDISPSTNNLINTLETLRGETDQIRVDSLVNLVRKKPGSEMFNVDLLLDAQKDNPAVQNLIKSIGTDDFGVRYVHLHPMDPDDEEPIDITSPDSDRDEPGANPQATVASMAKRAAKKRT